MAETTRRTFLEQAGAAAALASVVYANEPAEAAGSSDKIVLGGIGIGGQGQALLRSFVAQKDVEVAYICDADAKRAQQAAEVVNKATGKAPQVVTDMRKIFDDPTVHGVFIATPDHWHGPATLLALEAGKHVYVEKPCAHNIREGRLMVDAARRHQRVVQVGTQSRSSAAIAEAMKLLRDGVIGDVLVSKAWNSQKRGNIGHTKPSSPPPNLDFDNWIGPAPMVPYQSNMLPGIWRWWYAFGTGDIGNDGVHDIDIARWGLGVTMHPSTVAALGGKYFFDDDQQFPDTQYVVYEYPGDGQIGHKRQLVFEQRIWSPYVQEGFENGNAFYGTNGMMLLGKKEGWQLFGPKNKLIQQRKGDLSGDAHHRNFLDCVHKALAAGGKVDPPRLPNADIEIGHLSAGLAHLGNIVTRVGRTVRLDPQAERIVGDDEANSLLRRQYREGHWAVPKGT